MSKMTINRQNSNFRPLFSIFWPFLMVFKFRKCAESILCIFLPLESHVWEIFVKFFLYANPGMVNYWKNAWIPEKCLKNNLKIQWSLNKKFLFSSPWIIQGNLNPFSSPWIGLFYSGRPEFLWFFRDFSSFLNEFFLSLNFSY